MLEKTYAKALRRPRGFFGRRVIPWLDSNRSVYDGMEGLIEAGPGTRALEIGYGTGFGIRQYALKFGISVDGVDFSKLMHKAAARENADLIAQGRVRLFLGSFEGTPLEEGAYGLVYLLNVIYFWEDIEPRLKKVLGLLQPGGQLLIYMTDAEALAQSPIAGTSVFNKHRVADVAEALGRIGFADAKPIEVAGLEGRFYLSARRPG